MEIFLRSLIIGFTRISKLLEGVLNEMLTYIFNYFFEISIWIKYILVILWAL